MRALGKRIATDNISFLAGGVAFYGLLALFPALGAVIALLAILARPRVVREQLEAIQGFFPPELYDILHTQILLLVKQSDEKLGTALILSIIIAIFSATRGTKALLAALQIVFRIKEARAWWRYHLVSLAITCGGITLLLTAFLTITALPFLFEIARPLLGADITHSLSWIRWALLGGVMFLGIFLLYSLGPNSRTTRHSLKEELIGTFLASGAWLLITISGSFILEKTPLLHAAYGSLSAVVTLMLWMVASAYCILFGAAVTATLNEGNTDQPLR